MSNGAWLKPLPLPRTPQKKRLAVFLDGTWNAVGDNTNVWRLKALCAPKDSNGVVQLVYYDTGVNGFIGGMFGKGSMTMSPKPTSG